MDVAGGPPSGEDFDIALVNAAEDGVEGFDGTFAGTQGGRDGGGGTGAVAEGGPLLAFAAGEFVSQCFEVAGGVRRVAVGLELVIESELADGGGDCPSTGGEVVVTLAVRHTEALHEGGVGWWVKSGRRMAANSEERMSAWASFCWRRFMG